MGDVEKNKKKQALARASPPEKVLSPCIIESSLKMAKSKSEPETITVAKLLKFYSFSQVEADWSGGLFCSCRICHGSSKYRHDDVDHSPGRNRFDFRLSQHRQPVLRDSLRFANGSHQQPSPSSRSLKPNARHRIRCG